MRFVIGKCHNEGCSNDARYIGEDGELYCATCPLKLGIDSIRIADVPRLLALARQISEPSFTWDGSERQATFREVIGVRATKERHT